MSIGATAKALWTGSPAWRLLASASAAVTVVAIVTSMAGGSGGGSAPPAAGQVSASAGSGGQAAAPPPAAPSPPPGGGGVFQPAPGSVTVLGTPDDALARWSDFLARVDAAQREQRLGEHCSIMATALAGLKPEDLTYTGLDPARGAALAKARGCENDVEASDARLKELADAYAASRRDGSHEAVAALARAGARITDFDRQRALPAAAIEASEAAARATRQLQASDGRISELVQADQAVAGGAPPDRLAKAAAALDTLDRGRLDDIQRAAYERGQAARALVQESDARIDEIVSMVGGSTTLDPSVEEDLIAAVAALTASDLQRASPSQGEAIDRARGAAATLALQRLATTAADYDNTSSGFAAAEKLARIKELIDASGGSLQPTPEQALALDKAEAATARIEASNRRLNALKEAAEAWERNPDLAIQDVVMKAAAAVDNPFDRARLEAEYARASGIVEGALAMMSVNETGFTEANWSTVPINVQSDDEALAGRVRDGLRAAGYAIEDDRQKAAMLVRVSAGPVEAGVFTAGNMRLRTAKLEIGIEAEWAFGNARFIKSVHPADGAAGNDRQATETAMREGAAAVVAAFDEAVRADRASP